MINSPISREQRENLIEKAAQASKRAYSPYSGVRVGAALLDADGNIFSGANVENASYGLTVCAERVALLKAVTSGKKCFAALAIYSEDVFPLPCGACLQTLSEFFKGGEIMIVSNGKDEFEGTFKEFLPFRFSLGER